MDDRDFMFVRECPQLKPLLDKLLRRYKVHGYDDIYVVIDVIYRAGVSSGVDRALTELGLKVRK
jgi:hypothetical protein